MSDRDRSTLAVALEGVDTGFLLFDGDDRLVMCNPTARDMLAPIADLMVPGIAFVDLARASLDRGGIALGDEPATTWLKRRMALHRGSAGPFEQRLADGRWLQISECPTGDGGVASVYVDITEIKRREARFRIGEARFQRLTEIGVALSAEKNTDRLLERILVEAKSIAVADGGTIYLRVRERGVDTRPEGSRVERRRGRERRHGRDRRCGGDARAGDDRRDDRRATDDRAGGDRRRGGERRAGGDRRPPEDRLRFAIVRNDSLGIAFGGSTGRAVPFPPIYMCDPKSGAPNYANVATLAALTGATINVDDAYAASDFDFSGTKAFDAEHGYRSISFLTIPMKNKADEVIGVLQLINARDGERGAVVPFDRERQGVIEALASQAAVALDNQLLLDGQKRLLGAFIQVIAAAIDEKSPYTGGHCERVPVLTEMLADAACRVDRGPFADFDLDDDQRYELHIAAWLHDCGKVTTPEYVVDKATKLETIHDRIETVRTRFAALKRETEIAHLRAGDDDPAALARRLAEIDADRAFIEEANIGGERMGEAGKARVREIAKRRWRDAADIERPLLDDDEVYNLCVERGTLTPEERKVINDHIVTTIEMLEKLPFPKGLERVPEYAGGHHERMDGTGYPRGLTREQMSPPARMMAIADIFEALTAGDRPYKKAKSLSQSMAIMARMRDEGHIDPDLFALFVEQGVYRRYAERFLAPEQIDAVDHAAILDYTPRRTRRAAGER